MVDRACADPVGFEAGPGLGRGRGYILCCLCRPVSEEIGPSVTKRAFERHTDAHPAVIIQLGIGQPCERGLNGGQSSNLTVPPQMLGCRGRSCQATLAQALRQQCVGFIKEGTGILSGDFRQLCDIEISQPSSGQT